MLKLRGYRLILCEVDLMRHVCNWHLWQMWAGTGSIKIIKSKQKKTSPKSNHQTKTNKQDIFFTHKNPPNEKLCFSEVWCLGRWDGTLRMVLHGHLWWSGSPGQPLACRRCRRCDGCWIECWNPRFRSINLSFFFLSLCFIWICNMMCFTFGLYYNLISLFSSLVLSILLVLYVLP